MKFNEVTAIVENDSSATVEFTWSYDNITPFGQACFQVFQQQVAGFVFCGIRETEVIRSAKSMNSVFFMKAGEFSWEGRG